MCIYRRWVHSLPKKRYSFSLKMRKLHFPWISVADSSLALKILCLCKVKQQKKYDTAQKSLECTAITTFGLVCKNFPRALEAGLYSRCQKTTPIMVQIQIHPELHNPTQQQKSSTNPLNISVWTAFQSLVCPPNLDLLDLFPWSHSVAL